jgi:dTDP-4-amino-4,6-dideoxygalactose transaminase
VAVAFFDLTRQAATIAGQVRAAVERVFASQQFILGPAVEAFEQEFRQATGCGEAVGMSSGTDAQLAVLMAMGIGPGDAVLTSPFTFFATAGCVARLGAEPVFVDVRPDTLHLDAATLRAWLDEHATPSDAGGFLAPSGARLKVLIPVHLFGSMSDMDALCEVAREYGLRVIEDAAQAVGAEYPSQAGTGCAGTVAEAGFFSFFPTKNLGAAGDGGMAVCREPAFASRLRQLRNHGMTAQYRHENVGGNFRLDALQAAVLGAKLPHLPAWNDARRANAALYAGALAGIERTGALRLPTAPYAESGLRNHHTYHQYVVRARDRDGLREHLAGLGIGTAIYYPIPLHRQPCFAQFAGTPCPVADTASREVLALPIYPELSPDEIHEVAGAILRFYGA